MGLFVKHQIEGLAEGFKLCLPYWGLPPLYQSGVRFETAPGHGTGKEWFASPLATYTKGKGDCDQLVIWRIAELRLHGEHATCRTIWIGGSIHVQVRRTNGAVEDPSVALGAPVSWPLDHLWDRRHA